MRGSRLIKNRKRCGGGCWAVLSVVVLSVSLRAQDRIASQPLTMWSDQGVVTTNHPRSIEVAINGQNQGRTELIKAAIHLGVIELVQAGPSAKPSGGPKATLLQKFGTHPKRTQVIADCAKIIEQEVENKSGVSGLAISAGYRMVESFKPGFVSIVMDVHFDDFC